MTLEKDRLQPSATERIVDVLLAGMGSEEARRFRAALNEFPSFQIHGTRDFDEARELLGRRTFDIAVVERSSRDEIAAAFVTWLNAERPEVALLHLVAGNETPPAGDVLASQIEASIRATGSVRRRETMARWLEQESRVDHLTGLYNRTMFYDRLNEVCAAARRPTAPVTLIVLDVVGTRMVNETHGREAGDAMIQHAAAGITRSVRGADFAARIDGDDFGIIIPNADFELGQRIARRIAHELDRLNSNEWRGQLPVEVSFGVATGTDCSGSELFSAAMAELGRCKNRSLVLSEFPHSDGPDGPSVA